MKKKLLLLAMLCMVSFGAENWYEEIIGKELVNAEGKNVEVSELKGKTIGLYFSAHWCPPCRAFTPKLVEFRNKLVEGKKPFEIVFISFDKDEKAMMEYMTETGMAWKAIPYKSQMREKVAQSFNVNGIPTLLIFNKKGDLISKNGRGDVTSKSLKAFDDWNNK